MPTGTLVANCCVCSSVRAAIRGVIVIGVTAPELLEELPPEELPLDEPLLEDLPPEELPPDELPLEDPPPEELPLDTPPLELLELLEEDPPLLLDDPPAPGPATTP